MSKNSKRLFFRATLLLFSFAAMAVFVIPLQAHAASPSGSKPDKVCNFQPNSNVYLNVVNWGTDRVDTSPEFFYNNTTSGTVTKTWSSTIGVNITISASGQVSGDLNAIYQGVKGQINAGISFSISGSFTDSITYNIPSGRSIGVTYGLTRQIADGEYYFVDSACNLIDQGSQESWAPWRIEWVKVDGNLIKG